MLQDLLGAADIESFCSLFFRKGGADAARLPDLFKDACLLASRLYPEKYSPPMYFVPHSYMGLIAGWQLKDYLRQSDRWRPLIQCLWYFATEARKWELHPQPLEATAVSSDNIEQALQDAWEQGDLPAFYSAFANCQGNAGLSERASRTLLSVALSDHTNIGHKFLYVMKVMQLAHSSRWNNPTIFYAPMHFLFTAPRDLDIFHAARNELERHQDTRNGFASNRKTLEYPMVHRLRDAIVTGNEGILPLLIDLLGQGYSVNSIADGLLLVAAQLVYYAPWRDDEFWWVYPVHAFNFTGSVIYGLDFLPSRDRVLALLINGLYLRDIVKATGNIVIDGSIESLRGAGAASRGQLEEAVDHKDVAVAISQIMGLASGKMAYRELAESLVVLTSRTERFLFTHAAKYLYIMLHCLRDTPPAWSGQHLAAFTRFLTLAAKEPQVVAIADRLAKQDGK